ncbi:MAG: antibiotic biosynthesis monooxygenase [Methyloceanibacter sp.]
MTASPDDSPVTIVIQTRVEPSKNGDYAKWLRRISDAVAAQPGFVKETIMQPAPPVQIDWVILQSFASREAATTWLHSDVRQRLLAEAQPMLIGQDDVHLINDSQAGVLPAPVSAVISTRIKPGQEEAFREWDRKIKAVQSKSPGFQGYRFEPPIPGVQDSWLTILRFDSEANLKTWLNSPERKKLLEEAEAFTDACRVRTVRTGFDQWFETPGEAPPAAWKQNMIVLLVLYPLVFLLNAWVQAPILVGVFKLPYWLFLFINNTFSVLLLSLILPWVSRRLNWWLDPAGRNWKRDLAGSALIAGFYMLWLLIFWQYQTHFGLPF